MIDFWWKGRDSNPRPRHYETGRRSENQSLTRRYPALNGLKWPVPGHEKGTRPAAPPPFQFLGEHVALIADHDAEHVIPRRHVHPTRLLKENV